MRRALESALATHLLHARHHVVAAASEASHRTSDIDDVDDVMPTSDRRDHDPRSVDPSDVVDRNAERLALVTSSEVCRRGDANRD